MDWKIIKRKYPKVYSAVIKWHFNTHGILISNCNIAKMFNIRDLYDLFDKYKIYIGIKGKYDIDYGWAFSYCVDCNEETGDFENRSDAETAAFEECFKMLEGYLVNKNERLNQFLGQFISIKKISFIKALKYKNIALEYDIGDYPVSISYMEENVILKKEVLDACKKISRKEWNDADKIDFKFEMTSVNA